MRSVSFAALLLAALLLPFADSVASDRDGGKRAIIAYDDSDSDSDRRHGKRKQRDHRDRRDYRDYRDHRDSDSDRYRDRDRHSDWDSDSDRRRPRRNWVGWRWWGW